MFKGSYQLKKNYNVWMSHSDKVIKMPKGFETLASSESCKDAVIQNLKKKFSVFNSTQKLSIQKKGQTS